MYVNVLGTKYLIKESNKEEDSYLERMDGYCDTSTKTIVIDTFQNTLNSQKDLDEYRRQVIRHELVHAFLFESGLSGCSWADNEEMVDWIAIQFPKMMEIFQICEYI